MLEKFQRFTELHFRSLGGSIMLDSLELLDSSSQLQLALNNAFVSWKLFGHFTREMKQRNVKKVCQHRFDYNGAICSVLHHFKLVHRQWPLFDPCNFVVAILACSRQNNRWRSFSRWLWWWWWYCYGMMSCCCSCCWSWFVVAIIN